MINFVLASIMTGFFLIPYHAETADIQPINYETAYKLTGNKIEL